VEAPVRVLLGRLPPHLVERLVEILHEVRGAAEGEQCLSQIVPLLDEPLRLPGESLEERESPAS